MFAVFFFGGIGAVLGAIAGAAFPRRVTLVIGVGLALAAVYLTVSFSRGCEGTCEDWEELTAFAGVTNAVGWAVAAPVAAFVRRRIGQPPN